jgi:hypothetical protein
VTDQNSQGLAPAGWYPVAAGSAELRWWDGTQWTEHQHTLGQAPAGAYVVSGQSLRAPEGTKSGTVWIWIFAVLPLLQLAEIPFLAGLYSRIFAAGLSDPTAISRVEFAPDSGYFAIQGIGVLLYALYVIFAVFDYLALRARGVPRPFHWAWTFLGSLVYIIGRTVVVRRRTETGLAPMWVNILALVGVIVTIIAVVGPIITAAVEASVSSAG